MVGWYTPLAAVSAALVSLCSFWVWRELGFNVLMIAILVAIGLLGAGAYSIDARLYGRRRLVVGGIREVSWKGAGRHEHNTRLRK